LRPTVKSKQLRCGSLIRGKAGETGKTKQGGRGSNVATQPSKTELILEINLGSFWLSGSTGNSPKSEL